MDDATKQQLRAADPGCSTWLTANAGSGKTRVLTDRVAKLMLAGTPPERILCLTYTKAAASEMQNRLLKRLGAWAMLPDEELRCALSELGEAGDVDLNTGRRLFARAIETPGGLKVQTIHSFCATLLRRFPVEAGVPIGFTELDDRNLTALRLQVVEDMARDGDPALEGLTALHTGDRLDAFLAGLSEADFSAPPDADAIWQALGLSRGADEATLLSELFCDGEADLIAALIPLLRESNATDQGIAAKWSAVDWHQPDLAAVLTLAETLLYKSGANAGLAKSGKFPAVALQRGAASEYMGPLNALMQRAEIAHAARTALAQARKTLTLHRFAHGFVQRLAARKSARGWLDFDDLIRRSARLLRESSMAQWVLWRLDGGIDHILVDEAQDTSPGQWQLIRSLTDEFTSGLGAAGESRTLFVVGDPKQSIYSFQGADISVFDDMRGRFVQEFSSMPKPMQRLGLTHSFRSSPAILSVVDAVFQGDAGRGLGEPPCHIAFHGALPGRVDIWPPVPDPDTLEQGDWTDPVDSPALNSANTVLAGAIARQIKSMIGTPLYDLKQKAVRKIHAGDVLILVRRRKELFQELIGACKAEGLPVAGADRLKLAGELAVRDITATLSVLATPEDDLSLAAALRSPLFGLSEDDLFRLAHNRGKQNLWQQLHQSGHRRAMGVLRDLAGQADYLRPYDLISRLLLRHGGRARLLARLGLEAEDGIQELLSQALAYESIEPPNLMGFLVWLAADDVIVKRQLPSGSGGVIRIMTVHGAKGLESPVVILPETQKASGSRHEAIIKLGDLPLWRGRTADQAAPANAAVQAEKQRRDEEQSRLLYVAMTRAESWLIVAAAGKTGDGPESWYNLVADGAALSGLAQSRIDIKDLGAGIRLSAGKWPEAATEPAVRPAAAVTIDDALRQVPPPMRAGPGPVQASALGGAKVTNAQRESGADRAAAMLHGTRLHLLLEHLSASPEREWPELARNALAGAEGGFPADTEIADLLDELRGVFAASELKNILTPGPQDQVLREVPLTARIAGIGRLHGNIDLLIIRPGEVLAVDYKTNQDVPDTPEATPLGILRQMAAYRAALQQIYPGHVIRTQILWTSARKLAELPGKLLDDVLAALDPGGPGS